MLTPIFWTKVQGQKHPGRFGIVEHQISSIKVLFKINTKSHKHSGIKLLSSESKTQLVNQRKQYSYRRAYIYIYIYIYILTQSFWTGTKVIRRKHIIQLRGEPEDDTLTVIAPVVPYKGETRGRNYLLSLAGALVAETHKKQWRCRQQPVSRPWISNCTHNVLRSAITCQCLIYCIWCKSSQVYPTVCVVWMAFHYNNLAVPLNIFLAPLPHPHPQPSPQH